MTNAGGTGPAAVQPRDLVWVFAGTKVRRGVVIRIEEERAEVVWGTGTEREIEGRVVVEAKTRYAKALQLTKTTYFYPDNVVVAVVASLELIGVRCPPELFLRLRALAESSRPPEPPKEPGDEKS